ncbi:MAG: DNA repair protein RecO [Bdellovibrionales bacterium]|nr:DNA repair protein RecO [Bdellovibrionales bacterium]
MIKKEKIFILKTVKYGEADLILTGLCASGAKKSFIARGARKSKKRFSGGVLEPTHFVEIVFNEKPNASEDPLYTITEAFLKNGFTGIRKDYDRLELAFYLIKVLDKLSVEGSEDSENNYNLLGNTLKCLEVSTQLKALKWHFEIKLLHSQGVLTPELFIEEVIQTPIAHHEKLISLFDNYEGLENSLDHLMKSYIH